MGESKEEEEEGEEKWYAVGEAATLSPKPLSKNCDVKTFGSGGISENYTVISKFSLLFELFLIYVQSRHFSLQHISQVSYVCYINLGRKTRESHNLLVRNVSCLLDNCFCSPSLFST